MDAFQVPNLRVASSILARSAKLVYHLVLQRANRMAYFGEKRREYQRERHARWREMAVVHLGGRCAVCGTSENLEFHHKDPADKSFSIAHIWSHKWEKQVQELAKCELRCVTHHRQEHAAPHGARRRYDLGCRCDICVTFYRTYRAAFRLKHLEETRRRNRDYMRRRAATQKAKRSGSNPDDLSVQV